MSRLGLVHVAAGAALLVLTASAVRADNLSDKARAACKDEARSAGYEVEEVRDVETKGKGEAGVDLRLKRHGDSYRAGCVYDKDRDRARLRVADNDDNNKKGNKDGDKNHNDDRDKGFFGGLFGGGKDSKGNGGGGDSASNARQQCSSEAGRRNWRVEGLGKPDDQGKDVWRVPMTVRDNQGRGDRYNCYFNARDKSITLRIN